MHFIYELVSLIRLDSIIQALSECTAGRLRCRGFAKRAQCSSASSHPGGSRFLHECRMESHWSEDVNGRKSVLAHARFAPARFPAWGISTGSGGPTWLAALVVWCADERRASFNTLVRS